MPNTVHVAVAGIVALLVTIYLMRYPVGQAASSRSWPNEALNQGSQTHSECRPRRPHVLVYNRIPKAGSSTVIWLLRKLSVDNDFDLVLPVPYYNHSSALESITKAVISPRPTLVCNHFNFPEMLYADDQVAYMNIVREPIDRCASWYYFTRCV